MRIVIAIGGNAITGEHDRGTWEEQRANVRAVAGALVALRRSGHDLLVSHGNGPQVGALYAQHARAADELPPLPLDVLVAMTQGQIGYLLQGAIEEVDPRIPTAALITRIRVDAGDPSFSSPTKPIGRFFEDERSARAAAGSGLAVAADAGRGWRTVVASPRPREIVELAQLESLLERGVLTIAAGGGGIPVVRDGRRLSGTEAVIDKDRASAVLARAIGADLLVMLTAIDYVALDFGTRWQRDMARLTVSDAQRLLEAGEFPPGSMGPKVESAVRFVAGGGAAIITRVERLGGAVAGLAGTRIVPDVDGPSATVWARSAKVAA